MARSRSYAWPVAAGVMGLIVMILSIPQPLRSWVPILGTPSYHFGLDLAGGTELDFRISEDEINGQIEQLDKDIAALELQAGSPDRLGELRLQRQIVGQQKENLVEAIRVVLERRLNALGVSETTITPSYVGDERHFLVQCPGIVKIQDCVDTVGKTIQLEFKEELTEADANIEKEVRAKADRAMAAITQSGKTLQLLGADLGDDLGVAYADQQAYFKSDLPEGLADLWNKPPQGVVRREATVTVPVATQEGGTEEKKIPGIFLVQALGPKTSTGRVVNAAPEAFGLLAKQDAGLRYVSHEVTTLDAGVDPKAAAALRTMKAGELRAVDMGDGSARVLFLRLFTPGQQKMDVSHVLVPYAGANGAEPSVTRTKEEALERARSLKKRLDAGENFAALARANSESLSAKNGGSLGAITRNDLVPAFADAAFALQQGQISDVVETPFGFHIIKSDRAPYQVADQAGFEELIVAKPDGIAKAGDIVARLQTGKVQQEEEILTLRTLFFSLLPTGWKDTPLDGKHFRSAAVTQDQTTAYPMVQISFDTEGAVLFQELTKRNVGKRIAIFVGGEIVTAPTVNQEITGGVAVITGSADFNEARTLAQDLNTGAIPAPIHLTGQRTVEATLGVQALYTSVKAALIGMVLLMLYLLLVYRLLGLLASVALVVYALIFLAILQLPLLLVTGQYIVLTLAGLAGMILSIGLSVDTNVLIFERVKEELRKGKWLTTAVETGFTKAWPSIRDSNVSTLITCAILFTFGTSIVRGFAVTLAMGVGVSMFTGIVVTRWLARMVAKSSLAGNVWLYGGKAASEDVRGSNS